MIIDLEKTARRLSSERSKGEEGWRRRHAFPSKFRAMVNPFVSRPDLAGRYWLAATGWIEGSDGEHSIAFRLSCADTSDLVTPPLPIKGMDDDRLGELGKAVSLFFAFALVCDEVKPKVPYVRYVEYRAEAIRQLDRALRRILRHD